MIDYRFERECRTPYSEAYIITVDEEQVVGRVDLHFTPTIVNASLCVGENLTAEEVRQLVNLIDEELVLSSDTPREDFVVTVHQGRESGIFADEDYIDGKEGMED